MKTFICPICKKCLKLCISDSQGFSYFCEDCRYNIHDRPWLCWGRGYKTEGEAMQAAEAFISKFSPIMRLKVGDKILYNSCDDDYLAKVNDICRDKNNDVYLKVVILDSGDEDDVEAYQIIRWPWELEQKKRVQQ